jgi:hypothetical protein
MKEEEEEVDDMQEDDVKENIISDIRQTFDGQLSSIDSVKVAILFTARLFPNLYTVQPKLTVFDINSHTLTSIYII